MSQLEEQQFRGIAAKELKDSTIWKDILTCLNYKVEELDSEMEESKDSTLISLLYKQKQGIMYVTKLIDEIIEEGDEATLALQDNNDS